MRGSEPQHVDRRPRREPVDVLREQVVPDRLVASSVALDSAHMSRTEQIADFVRRQYLAEQGDVRANVESLFAEELEYHAGGETLTRDDLVALSIAVREGRRDGRRIELSEFVEEGDVVHWRLRATLPGAGPNGREVTQDSMVTAVFGVGGKIRAVWSEGSDGG